jgi:hypothetical protein
VSNSARPSEERRPWQSIYPAVGFARSLGQGFDVDWTRNIRASYGVRGRTVEFSATYVAELRKPHLTGNASGHVVVKFPTKLFGLLTRTRQCGPRSLAWYDPGKIRGRGPDTLHAIAAGLP